MTFHEILNQELQKQNISQRELANLTGLKEASISRYCNGQKHEINFYKNVSSKPVTFLFYILEGINNSPYKYYFFYKFPENRMEKHLRKLE